MARRSAGRALFAVDYWRRTRRPELDGVDHWRRTRRPELGGVAGEPVVAEVDRLVESCLSGQADRDPGFAARVAALDADLDIHRTRPRDKDPFGFSRLHSLAIVLHHLAVAVEYGPVAALTGGTPQPG